MPGQRKHRGRIWLVSSLAPLVGCGPTSDAPTVAPPVTPQPAAIRFDSASVRLAIGADRQLVAIVTDGTGVVLSGQDIRWNSINASVVSITQTGLAHGIVAGSALVTAVIGSHVAVDTVTVVASPNP